MPRGGGSLLQQARCRPGLFVSLGRREAQGQVLVRARLQEQRKGALRLGHGIAGGDAHRLGEQLRRLLEARLVVEEHLLPPLPHVLLHLARQSAPVQDDAGSDGARGIIRW